MCCKPLVFIPMVFGEFMITSNWKKRSSDRENALSSPSMSTAIDFKTVSNAAPGWCTKASSFHPLCSHVIGVFKPISGCRGPSIVLYHSFWKGKAKQGSGLFFMLHVVLVLCDTNCWLFAPRYNVVYFTICKDQNVFASRYKSWTQNDIQISYQRQHQALPVTLLFIFPFQSCFLVLYTK